MPKNLPVYGLQLGGLARSRARVTLSGSSYTDEAGQSLMPRGTNQGNWGENYEIDAATILSYGANCVRILLRVLRDEVDVDSYSQGAIGHLQQDKYQQFMRELDWLEAQGLYIIVAVDTDWGAGSRGLGTADWNFFDTLDTAGQQQYTQEFYSIWEYVVRNNMRRKRILAWELLPEPMQTGSNSSHAPILKAWYEVLMNRLRAIDPATPFLIGGRASYGLNTIEEVLFPDRSDVIYTADYLTGKVQNEDAIATDIEAIKLFRDTYNKPVLIQQFGRNTSEDEGNGTTTDNLGLTALNGGLFMLRAVGIPFTHWQYHQNSINPNAYALWYKIDADIDAADNWTPKPAEIASFTYHMGVTHAILEAAAIAAATACGGELFYVKSDLSNVFQNSAGTTPVTAAGQSIGRVNAVVGSRFFQQTSDALRPTLAASANGYAVGFLTASESWMSCDTAYFTTADTTQTVIVAARPPTSASNRNLLHCGTSTSIVRWPNLLVTATDECQASWRGDDNVLQSSSTTTLCDNRAIVATAAMTALNDKRVHLQGVQEGVTNTTNPGSIASITRLRWGAATSGANGLGGPSPLVFVCRNAVTAEQRRAIERFGAWLVGCPFRGAIPA
jgi:hypothetical protein